MSAAGPSTLPLAAIAAALSACAGPAIVAGEPHVVPRAVIAPYAMQEQCARLAAGDRLDYRYDSSAPVDFDIHYHEDNATLAPVVREQSTSDSGTFEAHVARDYCLLWQAGPPGAIISYRIMLRPPAAQQ
jgi:hypothetical protein